MKSAADSRVPMAQPSSTTEVKIVTHADCTFLDLVGDCRLNKDPVNLVTFSAERIFRRKLKKFMHKSLKTL